MRTKLLTITEAIAYQEVNWGKILFSRTALYAIARQHVVPVVRIGKGRLYISVSSLEALLEKSGVKS